MSAPLTSADHSVAVCANGRRIHILPGDERGRRLVEAGGNLNPVSLQAWQALARGPWTHIVDVGANYGEMLLNPDLPAAAHLIAAEPNPNVAALLQRSIGEAGLNVALHVAAVGATQAVMPLLIDDTWSGLSRLGTQQHPESGGHAIRSIEVPVTTLAKLLDDSAQAATKRVLVKIDVEGSECDVLRGLGGAGADLAALTLLLEVVHLGYEDVDWIVQNYQPEVFDAVSQSFIPVHGDGARLRRVLDTGAFHRQDIALRRRGRPE